MSGTGADRKRRRKEGRKESAGLTKTPGFTGGTRAERKSIRKEEEEGRKENAVLSNFCEGHERKE
jgi:hypothetical protein